MNTMTVSTAVWIAMACMIIGFVTGGFIGFFNKDKRKDKKSDTPSPPPPVSSPEQPDPLADPEKFTELVRLWREKKSGNLFVETSGHLLGSAAPLNKNQKIRFIDLIKELAIWLELESSVLFPTKQPANEQGTSSVPEKIESNTPTGQVKASEPVKTNPIPAAPAISQVEPSPVVTANIQSPVPPAATSVPVYAPPPVPIVQPVNNTGTDKPKKPATSMVEQIDEILQEMIQSSTDPTRQIRLVEERNDGVIVWVGKEHFVGIDSVTDQSAVNLIRAAVKEWDRRTETRPAL